MAEAFNEHFSTIGCKLTDAIALGSANSAESFLKIYQQLKASLVSNLLVLQKC